MHGFGLLNTTPAEFVNEVRANLPKGYRDQLPIAEAGQTSFTGIGQVLDEDNEFANRWHKSAINMVAKILQRDNKIVNPLAEFEGELVTSGAYIEEMIFDTAATFMFDPKKAEVKLFERRPPELKAAYHTHVRDVTSIRTLQDTTYTQMFTNVNELDRYVIQVTQSMLSGNETEKYYTTKKLISESIYNNKVRVLDLGADVTAKTIQKAILKVSKLMIHPNRFFNMANVGQPGFDPKKANTGINMQADFPQLRMLLPVGTSVDLNVDFFASAFHLDAVKSGIAIKEVDYFPNIYQYNTEHVVTAKDIENGFLNDYNFEIGETIPKGNEASEAAYLDAIETGANDIDLVFDASRIQAVILDRRALMINPALKTTFSTQPNAAGRYNQLILNDKEYFNFSAFVPSCVIMANDPVEPGNVYDIKIDGVSIVDANGIADIPYTDETGKAADEVFPDQDDQVPTMSNSKDEIIAYLQSKNISYDEKMSKAELLKLIQ